MPFEVQGHVLPFWKPTINNAFHVPFGNLPKTPKISVFNENSQWFIVFSDAKID